MSYNIKTANAWFIKTGAFLARDLDFDPENPPTETQIENWRREVMRLISQHQAAHAEIQSLQHKLDQRDKWVKIAGGIDCPECDNSGGYAGYDAYDRCYQVQCQFCYECPDSKFNLSTPPSVDIDICEEHF